MIPALPLTGGCQCGAVRYRLTEMPLSLYACHCTNCQTMSGSAFGLSMPIARSAFEITQGQLKPWHRTTPSGAAAVLWFCGDCGCRVLGERPSRPGVGVLRGGSLDDTAWLTPVAHIWTRSAQSWMRFSEDVLTYPMEPEDFGPIAAAWRRRYGAG
jgi:hypothetical protein